MLALDELLLGDVLVATPGCPDMTAERAISRATRQFCRDSEAWRHTTDGLAVIANLREVYLDLPTDTALHHLYWVTLDKEPLTGVSFRNLSDRVQKPRRYALTTEGRLHLDPIPSETTVMGLVAHMSLVPVMGASILPDELEPYLEMVQSLAVAKLLSMPSVEWRDRRGAGDAMSFYQDALRDARRQGNQYNQPIHRKVAYGGI